MSRALPGGGGGAIARRVATVLVVVAFLGACVGPGLGASGGSGVANPGYVSGDGTVTQWAPDGRGEPVDLVGVTYDGTSVDLAQWRGDVVVVNFWYAACPPCRAEAPDLVAVADEYADRGVRFLGVNSTDDAGAAAAFERTFEVPYASIDDAGGAGVAAMQGAVPLRAVPTTVVIDEQGRIAARVLGRTDRSTLGALVDDALGPDASADPTAVVEDRA